MLLKCVPLKRRNEMETTNRTDHSGAILTLRESDAPGLQLAADLLEMHDNTSLSLDNWPAAKDFIESRVKILFNDVSWQVLPNGA
jgi:hypothetical protein